MPASTTAGPGPVTCPIGDRHLGHPHGGSPTSTSTASAATPRDELIAAAGPGASMRRHAALLAGWTPDKRGSSAVSVGGCWAADGRTPFPV
jgi:hypothetical protein